ncbi:hypothetical protein TNCV_2585821 [Trichonephila clavipes]|nr:hypothetical protein TNCV_2585821 [Trichonephila clavipes]
MVRGSCLTCYEFESCATEDSPIRENEHRLARKSIPSGNEQNTSYAGSLSKEFIALGGDNVYPVPIMANKDILESVPSSQNIIDADFKTKIRAE